MTVTLEAAVAATKEYLAAMAAPWSAGHLQEHARRQDAARAALEALPTLSGEVQTLPIYPSHDDAQTGFMLVRDLGGTGLAALPRLIAKEMLEALELDSTLTRHINRPASRKHLVGELLLLSYGPRLAAILAEGIDEALAGRSRGFRCLETHDGARARLDAESADFEEAHYCEVAATDPIGTPVEILEMGDALEGARELIEDRDRSAEAVRSGRAYAHAL